MFFFIGYCVTILLTSVKINDTIHTRKEREEKMYYNLKAELKRADIPITYLAKALGITRVSVHNKINGTINWNVVEALKVKAIIERATKRKYEMEELFKKEER